MCGICGVIGAADPHVVEPMTARLAHRGPDDGGTFIDAAAGVALGHRRLAILDLSAAGHQPMFSDDGAVALVYNGEIYNFESLRDELRAKGASFRSGTDTEVILKLYEAEGIGCVRRLNGIFAFGLWDARRRALFLARDHFGIKPLYYAVRGGMLAFASEIKALFEVPGIEPRLDHASLDLFLRFLWTPDPRTTFEGIAKLPAGHYAEWRDGRLTQTRFWDLTFPAAGATPPRPEAELVAEFRDRFTRAVGQQLVSDVPLGAFLSAGLDSTAIVAAMTEVVREPVRTYTIAFHPRHRLGELTLDDPAIAARTAKTLGCRHTEIVVDPDVADLLPRLVYHMDEPTADPALVMAYLVSREARREVTVLLSGIGGDEMLGGYRKYLAAEDARRYQRVPEALRMHVLEPLFRRAPAKPGTPWGGYGRLIRKWGRSASLSLRDGFIMNGTYQTDDERQSLLRPEIAREIDFAASSRLHQAAFDRVAHADPLHQMLYLDSTLFMPSLNLTYNDKMSMASGVEVRVPFLDWELAEWLAHAVPPGLKLHGRTTKYLLRQAFADRIPAEVLSAPKAGFGAPIGKWLLHDLREMVDDVLHPDRIRRRGLFEPAVVARWIREQREGRSERAWQVWQLLTLELWFDAFFEGRGAPAGERPAALAT